jgi:hypothetical protein
VFTAQYALSPYIKQIRFIFKGLMVTFGGVIVIKFVIRDNFIQRSSGEIPYLPEYEMILHITWPSFTIFNFQENVCTETVKCVHDYKVTPHLSSELRETYRLIFR